MRVADGDGEKLQEPQPRAVVGRRDQRRQGQRGRGKGGELSHYPSLRQRAGAARGSTRRRAISACRSEEHTSELQSLMRISYAVFCLKKKSNQMSTYNNQLQRRIKSIDMSQKRK